jgi:hypothetical protein
MNMEHGKISVLDKWQEYIDAVKEEMIKRKITSMESIEYCDRCGDFLYLVMKDDGDVKYFCPKDKVSIGWEAVALRGLN